MSAEQKRYINKPLLSLFALLILINLPLLFSAIIPQHDTLMDFKTFYFIYNEFFVHSDLPLWFPFGFYGVQSDLYLLLSPSLYFTGFCGWILGVKNVLLLYNLSLVLEQIVLLYGSYLLARRLFVHKAVVFLVPLMVIFSTTIFFQVFLDFRPYIYLPLIVFFLVRFFEDFKPHFLICSALVFFLSFFGLPPYYAPISTLTVSIIFFTLLVANYRRLPAVFRHQRYYYLYAIALLALFCLVVLIYYSYISNAMNLTEGISSGRDPVTRKTLLDVFLTFPKATIGWGKFSSLFYPSYSFAVSGLSLNVGLITLLLALYAIVTVRRAVFWAFLIAGSVLVVFSLGSATALAQALYHWFPMMEYYRHIGYVVTTLKLFLPFMAGFGLESFINSTGLKDESEGKGPWTGRLSIFVKVLISVFTMFEAYQYTRFLNQYDAQVVLVLSASMLFFYLLMPYYKKKPQRVLPFLILCVLAQGFAFQIFYNYTFFVVSNQMKPLGDTVVNVSRYRFQPERTPAPVRDRSRHAMQLVARRPYPLTTSVSVAYTYDYNFLQWDPCLSDLRTDFLNTYVASLIRAKSNSKLLTMPGDRLIVPVSPSDLGYMKVIGCLSPKLALFSNVDFAKNEDEAIHLIKQRRGDEERVLISDLDPKRIRLWKDARARSGASAKGNIRVLSFSANELRLQVDIENESGLWLRYADAFHPGWRAYVNGKPTPIERADIAFKTIWLDKGRSTVQMVFVDSNRQGLKIKLLILFELLSIVIILLVGRYRGAGRRS